MIQLIGINNTQFDPLQFELKKKKGVYIEDVTRVPDEIIYGIYQAMKHSRADHILGIYSYFFTAITRIELADRFLIKNRNKGKTASIYYINKYIISPTATSIKEQCDDISFISILSSAEEHNIIYQNQEPSTD